MHPDQVAYQKPTVFSIKDKSGLSRTEIKGAFLQL